MIKVWEALKKRVLKFGDKFQVILLQRFHRIITVENKNLHRNKDKHFIPILRKGQLVNVDFIGQGSVLDENHPAIVWTADKKSEHIVVIPLTSKDGNGRYEQRNLGKIEGYNDLESIVKINQPHSVSRKSISLIKQDVEGKFIDVIISNNQLIILEDFFRQYHLKEPSFQHVIENKIGLMLPLKVPEVDIVQSNRPVIYFVKDNILWYRFSDQSNMNQIELVKLKIRNAERKVMINHLFSNSFDKRKVYYSKLQESMNKKAI